MFGIGRKDKKGKQVRVEHRGKYTRASRTGGVALRVEKKIAGVNVTANTKHGIRVSKKVTKGVRVALQSGHFRLIGRWKSGPLGLNLSKTGFSASYKNQVGTYNFLKPQYSSFKMGGIHLRGKNAAQFQLFYIVFIKGPGWFLNVFWSILVLSYKIIIWLVWLLSLPILFLIELTFELLILVFKVFSKLIRRGFWALYFSAEKKVNNREYSEEQAELAWAAEEAGAVDIGFGRGEIEDLEALSLLDSKSLEALLAYEDFSDKDHMMIEKIMTAKQQGISVEYNDNGWFGKEGIDFGFPNANKKEN